MTYLQASMDNDPLASLHHSLRAMQDLEYQREILSSSTFREQSDVTWMSKRQSLGVPYAVACILEAPKGSGLYH